MATGGAPGLQDGRCLAGSPADKTDPPLLHHLPTHPPDHLQHPEADLHPQPDHGTDPGATDHAHRAGTGRPQLSTSPNKTCGWPKHLPQCKDKSLLSPGVSEFTFHCRMDVAVII